MSLIYADRVQETVDGKPDASTAYNLSGAVIGHQTFVAGVGDANLCMYAAQQVDGQGVANGAWEVGVGTVTAASPDTLARTSLLASSSGSFIDWSITGENSNPRVYVVSPAAFNQHRGGATPGPFNGNWFGPYMNSGFVSKAVVVDRLWASLISWPVGVPITKMGIEITTAGGFGTSRLGIYEDAGGKPGALLVDAGNWIESVEIHVITLASKVYPKTPWIWAVYVGDDVSTFFKCRDSPSKQYAIQIGYSDAGIGTPVCGVWVAAPLAPGSGLPATFGTPTLSTNIVPEVRLQT